MSSDSWCLIESDPGLFTELIFKCEIKDVEVEEVYSLDLYQDTVLPENVYGFIFLFKYTEEKQVYGQLMESPPEDLFFAHQVIQNACATQAILSILMNAPIELGKTLKELKEFTKEFSPDLKGLSIGNCDLLRKNHNSFSNIDFDKKEEQEDEDSFHFISYIPFQGQIVELDGLQPNPIAHGPYGNNWIESVKPVIENRIASYAGNEIRFNLMAVIKDKRVMLRNQLSLLQPTDPTYQQIQDDLKMENEKHAQYQKENAKRQNIMTRIYQKFLES